MKRKHIVAAMAALTLVVAQGCSSGNAENEATVQKAAEPVQTETVAWMPEDATVTSSGLGIVIENEGDSTRADYDSNVVLHYRGTLPDGRVFDSSYDRGMPAEFSPAQVVPGFGEGIRMLGKGGKATLYIPSKLAYGPRGVPQAGIGPNQNLIFEIEILDIVK